MTAIAGIAEDGVVWLGGDSAAVADYSIATVASPKVFLNGDLAFGFVESVRMGQLLQYELEPPKHVEGESPIDYLVRRLVPVVRDCFSDHGFQEVDNERIEGGQFMVGYRGELFTIESNYQVLRFRDDYCGLGCGQDLLLGSLHTTQNYLMPPRERILLALKAAERFSAGVRGPFTVVCTKCWEE